jgi:DNA-binding NtrC family response regulator
LPDFQRDTLPTLYESPVANDNMSDREILYKVLFDMRQELTDLKKMVLSNVSDGKIEVSPEERAKLMESIVTEAPTAYNALQIPEHGTASSHLTTPTQPEIYQPGEEAFNPHEEVEESLSLEEKERELIEKALTKYNGRRKLAAQELGISERTLYRKIKEYDLK